MSRVIADIFVTTCGRPELFARSLDSFAACTPNDQYRLTVIDDTGIGRNFNEVSCKGILAHTQHPNLRIDHQLIHNENLGLGPSINQALAHIDALQCYEASRPPFICYLQDDLLYTPGWLERLTKMFMLHEKSHRVLFASGVECIEHKEDRREIGPGLRTQRYIRAASMFARSDTWMSMFPIPPIDLETGRKRAKPNDGMGSGVDWWFMRNADESVEKTKKTCLVLPGLLQHAGYKDSTWLKRELPESESDKVIVTSGALMKHEVTQRVRLPLDDSQIVAHDEGHKIDWRDEMVKDSKGG